MIQITPQMRILVAVQPVDFRKGIDGLAALCRQALASDPLDGALFVFCSRRGHAIKCLTYDGQGFWICQNMHAPQCAVNKGRKSSLPLSSSIR
jgi:transposase